MNGCAQRHARHSRGFTLVETLVVTAIVLTLAAILYPVIDGAVEKSHQGDCLTNQKQLALSLLTYTQDHDGMLPLPSDWVTATGLPTDSGVMISYVMRLAITPCW